MMASLHEVNDAGRCKEGPRVASHSTMLYALTSACSITRRLYAA